MAFDLLKKEIDFVKSEVEKWLDKLLPADSEYPERLHQAMRYSIFAGGKRLRPFLAYLGFKIANGTELDQVFKLGAALEMIHTYTLIHDDLPSMDNDDLRRGKPTCHKQFDEATAILAGDALYAHAFYILSQVTNNCKIIEKIAFMSGSYGIVGGQMADILSEGEDIDLNTLEYIHKNKTAVFIANSISLGALLAQPENNFISSKLFDYGLNIGLAFQIIDDILDVIGDEKILGKPIGSDANLNKATFPKLVGLEKSKEIAHDYIEKSKEIAKIFVDYREILNELSDFIINRMY